jgi:hypothetical protein
VLVITFPFDDEKVSKTQFWNCGACAGTLPSQFLRKQGGKTGEELKAEGE